MMRLILISVLVSGTAAVASTSCCSQLYMGFPAGTVLRPASNSSDSSLYQTLSDARWSSLAIMSPDCIFRPTSVDEVSQAVKILTSSQCQFAIKAGGHMPVPGANNIDNGVSIDLSWLNQTVLSPDRSFVSLGAGGTWSNAYHNFAAENLAFPGGVCGTTGVGGVSLGGGESLFQPRVGWVVDNVISYEIVLAFGDIAIANKTTNPDLYKALKGGGSNFGIVTRVDVAAFDQGDLWAGQIIIPALNSTVEQALLATTRFTEQNNVNVNAGLQTAVINFADGNRIIDFGFSSTDGASNPEILQAFTAMQPQILNTVKTRSLSNVIEEFDLVLPAGYRQLGATVTFVNDVETIKAVHAIFDKIYESIKDVPNMDWIVFYNPQPQVTGGFSAVRGGNMLGLENVTDDLIIAFVAPRWLDAAYDNAMFQAAQRWVAEVQSTTQALGTSNPFLYLNFALASQKPFCSYGTENVAFLQETAKKYDPDGVFQTLVPGGFKISEACDGEIFSSYTNLMSDPVSDSRILDNGLYVQD